MSMHEQSLHVLQCCGHSGEALDPMQRFAKKHSQITVGTHQDVSQTTSVPCRKLKENIMERKQSILYKFHKIRVLPMAHRSWHKKMLAAQVTASTWYNIVMIIMMIIIVTIMKIMMIIMILPVVIMIVSIFQVVLELWQQHCDQLTTWKDKKHKSRGWVVDSNSEACARCPVAGRK